MFERERKSMTAALCQMEREARAASNFNQIEAAAKLTRLIRQRVPERLASVV